MTDLIALKRFLRPGGKSTQLIKGDAAAEPAAGLYPGFSASGQDVWLHDATYSGPGLILSAVGARCGKVFLAEGKWGVVANTSVLIPGVATEPRFLWYLVNNEDFWEKGGTAQPYVRVPETLARKVWVPPLAEQRAIADYLDVETARIDALIAKKQQLIHLLEERWESRLQAQLIETSLGGGGRSYRLKHACKAIFLGLTSTVDYVEQGGVPLVRATDIRGGVLNLENARKISHEQHSSLTRRRSCQRSDVLLSKSGSIGEVAIVDVEQPFSIYESIFALRARPGVVLPRYLLHLLRSGWCQGRFRSNLTGMGVPHLNMSDIVDVEVWLPPVDVQEQHVNELDERTRSVQVLKDRLSLQVELLAEHRQALITAAVTGEFSVQGAT